MKLIASYQVDHTRIVPGIYVSRRDKVEGGWSTTFDVRMKTPNKEPAIPPNAMHTIEHVVATYLRNFFFLFYFFFNFRNFRISYFSYFIIIIFSFILFQSSSCFIKFCL